MGTACLFKNSEFQNLHVIQLNNRLIFRASIISPFSSSLTFPGYFCLFLTPKFSNSLTLEWNFYLQGSSSFEFHLLLLNASRGIPYLSHVAINSLTFPDFSGLISLNNRLSKNSSNRFIDWSRGSTVFPLGWLRMPRIIQCHSFEGFRNWNDFVSLRCGTWLETGHGTARGGQRRSSLSRWPICPSPGNGGPWFHYHAAMHESSKFRE